MKYTTVIFDLCGVLFEYAATPKGYQLQPIEKGIDLMHLCTQADKKLFVLSNLSTATLEQLVKAFPEIFNLFEGLVCSEMVGVKKPDPKLFEYLIEKYRLNPQNCIFIDDAYENTETAEQLGMTGIVCDDFETVEKRLKTIFLLSANSHKTNH